MKSAPNVLCIILTCYYLYYFYFLQYVVIAVNNTFFERFSSLRTKYLTLVGILRWIFALHFDGMLLPVFWGFKHTCTCQDEMIGHLRQHSTMCVKMPPIWGGGLCWRSSCKDLTRRKRGIKKFSAAYIFLMVRPTMWNECNAKSMEHSLKQPKLLFILYRVYKMSVCHL